MSALLLRAQRKPDEDANQYLTISLEPRTAPRCTRASNSASTPCWRKA